MKLSGLRLELIGLASNASRGSPTLSSCRDLSLKASCSIRRPSHELVSMLVDQLVRDLSTGSPLIIAAISILMGSAVVSAQLQTTPPMAPPAGVQYRLEVYRPGADPATSDPFLTPQIPASLIQCYRPPWVTPPVIV